MRSVSSLLHRDKKPLRKHLKGACSDGSFPGEGVGVTIAGSSAGGPAARGAVAAPATPAQEAEEADDDVDDDDDDDDDEDLDLFGEMTEEEKAAAEEKKRVRHVGASCLLLS